MAKVCQHPIKKTISDNTAWGTVYGFLFRIQISGTPAKCFELLFLVKRGSLTVSASAMLTGRCNSVLMTSQLHSLLRLWVQSSVIDFVTPPYSQQALMYYSVLIVSLIELLGLKPCLQCRNKYADILCSNTSILRLKGMHSSYYIICTM